MRAGIGLGIAAYGLWGLFPLFFHLLADAPPVEVLAHRIVWSLLAVLGVLAVASRLGEVGGALRDRRAAATLAAAGGLIAVNWGLYIYAVSEEHVIEAALGYFVTPIVSVAFGIAVFGERLRALQVVAIVFGIAAVVLLTVSYGRFPWIALVLAGSFGTYGMLKKLVGVGVGAPAGLAVETLVVAVPAVALLAVLAWTGRGTATTEGAGHLALLIASGPVTALPLLLFAGAVRRVPLSTIGLLQYLTPVVQFLLGWLVLGEAMPAARWAGFALVWVALVVLTVDGLRQKGIEPGRVSPQAA